MPYSYDQETYNNPSRLKRWSHRKRFDVAIQALDISSGQSLLDYGMGDTHLIDLLRKQGWSGTAVGYEPVVHTYELLETSGATHRMRIVQHTSSLRDHSFDRIACMEVFEHLPERIQHEALKDMKRLLKPNGNIILSAPIETGLSGFTKNSVRALLRQSHEPSDKTSPWCTAWRSLMDLPIERTEDLDMPYIEAHAGFQIGTLPPLFKKHGFTIEQTIYSPMPLLRGVLNSQKVFVLTRYQR